MKMTLKNAKMMEMLHQLEPILPRRDKIGYVAARNFRIISNSLTEYFAFRRSLVEKYGVPDKDENGNELDTISLKVDSPQFKTFCSEMEPFNNMEHDLDLMIVKFEDAVGVLSGEELLSVDWMFED